MDSLNRESGTVSVGDWIISNIIVMIPIVGIIMLLVWAFSRGTKRSKSNWAKGLLVILALFILLSIAMRYFMPGMMETIMLYDTSVPATIPVN